MRWTRWKLDLKHIMRVEANASLKPYNTFGVDVAARHLFHLESVEDLNTYREHPQGYTEHQLLLSGGSNMLLLSDIPGSVARIAWTGRQIISQDDQYVIVEAQAGENWHDFVQWTLDQGFGGLENLSLIPGCVGTSPVQNIGAYGVEIADRMASLDYYRWADGSVSTMMPDECQFGYRQSVFKGDLKDRGVITAVRFKLTVRDHDLRTHYGAIETELGGTEPTPRSVANAVIAIRQSKLPDPAVLGNSGSFFKNPVVQARDAQMLLDAHPNMPNYPQPDGTVKLAAGWLIDQSGWKGAREGDAGMHAQQALVLVNHGNATGAQLWSFAQKVQKDVAVKFGVELQPEVNLIPAQG